MSTIAHVMRIRCAYALGDTRLGEEMLSLRGLDFEGRLHCGLDDSRNIARLVAELLKAGRRGLRIEFFEEFPARN